MTKIIQWDPERGVVRIDGTVWNRMTEAERKVVQDWITDRALRRYSVRQAVVGEPVYLCHGMIEIQVVDDDAFSCLCEAFGWGCDVSQERQYEIEDAMQRERSG